MKASSKAAKRYYTKDIVELFSCDKSQNTNNPSDKSQPKYQNTL